MGSEYNVGNWGSLLESPESQGDQVRTGAGITLQKGQDVRKEQ
jgi:hypothetical protein